MAEVFSCKSGEELKIQDGGALESWPCWKTTHRPWQVWRSHGVDFDTDDARGLQKCQTTSKFGDGGGGGGGGCGGTGNTTSTITILATSNTTTSITTFTTITTTPGMPSIRNGSSKDFVTKSEEN